MIKYLLVGIYFAVVMIKSEAVSWFRIQEMFRFHDFHMYGIILSAIAVGAILLKILKATQAKSLTGKLISVPPKKMNVKQYLIGGTIFGMGWAMIGACPGPIFVQAGAGYYSAIISVFAALLGTYLYSVLRPKLPH